MSDLSVTIAPPLGTPAAPTVPLRLTGVSAQVSTSSDAGFDTATITLPDGMAAGAQLALLAGRGDLPPFGHVQVSLAGRLVWEGALTGYRMDRLTPVGITAAGYGHVAAHRTWSATADTPVLAALDAAIAATASWMARDPLAVDPAVTLTAAQLTRVTVADLLRSVNGLASAGGVPVAGRVWEGPTVTIRERRPPVVPTIVVDADDPGLSLDDVDLTSVVNRVVVRNGTTTLTLPDVTEMIDTSVIGIERVAEVVVDDGVTADAMRAIGLAVLAERGALRPAAQLRAQDGRLRGASGGLIDAWTVRAGDWALVAGIGMLEIVQTTVDLPSGSWSARLGAPPLGARWSGLVSGAIARAYRRVSPITWLTEGA